MALLVYTVSAFGLAYIVGHSKISLPFRQAWADTSMNVTGVSYALRTFILDLVECPACFGFWIGLGAAIYGVVSGSYPHVFLFVLPLYTSGSNYIIGRMTGLIREE